MASRTMTGGSLMGAQPNHHHPLTPTFACRPTVITVHPEARTDLQSVAVLPSALLRTCICSFAIRCDTPAVVTCEEP